MPGDRNINVIMNFYTMDGKPIHQSYCDFTLDGTKLNFTQCSLVPSIENLNIDYPNVNVYVHDIATFHKKLCDCATCEKRCYQRS